jgi:aminoglycoside phosphotransferase (APT) family kinase protein
MEIDEHLARRLVDRQFPQWAGLSIRPVDHDGWDNRTFRLGDRMTVRLPSGSWYALQVEKEQRWLPVLAPQLPLPIPVPIARGKPDDGYPYPWSVYGWLDGDVATHAPIADLTAFATAVADFLAALRRIDPTGGPAPGKHNWHRGGPLTTYAGETVEAVEALGPEVDGDAAMRVWEDAVAATWTGDPVWFHGDVATGNLLVRDGRLAAVIDFGSSGVGDPACDVVIAWTLFDGASRDAFRSRLGVDPATWSRGRGWAIWKALITLVGHLNEDDAAGEAAARRDIARVVADHAAGR